MLCEVLWNCFGGGFLRWDLDRTELWRDAFWHFVEKSSVVKGLESGVYLLKLRNTDKEKMRTAATTTRENNIKNGFGITEEDRVVVMLVGFFFLDAIG